MIWDGWEWRALNNRYHGRGQACFGWTEGFLAWGSERKLKVSIWGALIRWRNWRKNWGRLVGNDYGTLGYYYWESWRAKLRSYDVDYNWYIFSATPQTSISEEKSLRLRRECSCSVASFVHVFFLHNHALTVRGVDWMCLINLGLWPLQCEMRRGKKVTDLGW